METKDRKFNDYPEALRYKLGPKESVAFRLKDAWNPAISKFILRQASVPSQDQIQDEEGNIIEIAYKPKFNNSTSQWEFAEIWLDPQSMCTRVLYGNNVNDQQLYQYLKACNFNATNERRDTSKEAIFEEIIPDKQSSDKREIRSNKIDAVLVARSYSEEQLNTFLTANEREIKPFAKKHNMEHELSHLEGKRNLVEFFAEYHPNKFLNTKLVATPEQGDAATKIKALKAKGLLSFDEATREWVLWDERVAFVATRKNNQQVRDFAEYVTTTEKGREVMKLLLQKEAQS